MKKQRLAILCSAAFATAALMGPTQGSAATVTTYVIDDFTTAQSVSHVPSTGLTQGSEVEAPEAIGGFRDLYVETNGGVENATSAETYNGNLNFSNKAQQSGRGWLTWDGQDNDPFNVNEEGLGGLDLTGGLINPFFAFDVASADHELEITFRVWDMLDGYSEYNETLPEASELNPNLYFTQFEGNADFRNVGALQFFVNAPTDNLDATIRKITVEASPIPLPASSLLLLGGLGGLFGLRRRRNKKA